MVAGNYVDRACAQRWRSRISATAIANWGAAFCFYRACRFPEQIAGIVYMEAMVRPRLWSDLPEGREPMFRKIRGPEGEQMVLQDNFFVEKMLFEFGVIRTLAEEEKAV